jgi:hypothetical protein
MRTICKRKQGKSVNEEAKQTEKSPFWVREKVHEAGADD